MRRARRVTGSSCHASNASAATRTAWSTSGGPDRGTRPSTSPVAGSGTSSRSSGLGGDRPPADEVLDLAHGLL